MRALRWARRAGGFAAVGTAGVCTAAYFDDDWRKTVAIASVGSVCRLFIRGPNNFKLHESQHLESALARPKGTALLSVSNHIATVDDPHLISSIVPYWTLLHGCNEMRWGVCGDDVCFRPGTFLCRFADAAKVLPIRRGAGIWQPELDAIIEKLRRGGETRRALTLESASSIAPHCRFSRSRCTLGLCHLPPDPQPRSPLACAEWVHYFPEGKIRQDGRVHPFRRGVGRLAAEGVDEETQRLQVLPFYHTGTDTLQPTTPTSKAIFSWPNFGVDIHVIFGEPVDLSRLLALRGTPPFDTRPELLYEVIAHTLEERVRELRDELHRKLGVSPVIPQEGGCFDGDDAVLHPDAVSRSRLARNTTERKRMALVASARAKSKLEHEQQQQQQQQQQQAR